MLAACLLLGACASVHAAQFAKGVKLPMEQNANYNRNVEYSAVGDANGDGRMDVVFFTDGFGTAVSEDYQFYVYVQQADGTMSLATRQTYAPGNKVKYYTEGALFTDLDQDGKAELVLGVGGSRDLAVLKRGNDGQYQEAARITSPIQAGMKRAQDLDGDGQLELMVKSYNALAVFKGKGQLAFENPVYVLDYGRPGVGGTSPGGGFVLDDIDADGRTDMFTVDPWGFGHLGFNRGAKEFFFGEPVHVDNAPQWPDAVAVGRFDSQRGEREIAVTNQEKEYPTPNSVRVYQAIRIYGLTDEGFRLRSSKRYEILYSVRHNSMLASDLDDDGDDDLVIFGGDHVYVLFSTEGGVLSEPLLVRAEPSNSSGQQPVMSSTHIADFNGDGCKDIGHSSRSYAIYYRTDCPSGAAKQVAADLVGAPRPAVSGSSSSPRQKSGSTRLLEPLKQRARAKVTRDAPGAQPPKGVRRQER